MCDEVEGVIRAIVEDNPESPVEVIDRGAYVRVQAPGFLRVTRDSLERHVGRDFEMRQLEGMLSAFAGRITTSSDEIIWHYRTSQTAGSATS
jgi:toluene monooxygenase system protein D